MIKVAYFSNQFADLEGHGLARYSRHLFKALQYNFPEISIKPVSAWSSLSDTGLAQLKKDTGLQILPWGRRLTPLCWAFLNNPKIERWMNEPIDVVHATALGYPVATRKPYIVTIHDLGPLTHPEFFTNTRPWVMEKSLKQAVRKAAAIICVSQSTADEVLDYVGSEVQGRLRVIYEGVDEMFFAPCDETRLKGKAGIADGNEYILMTGKMSPRKNLPAVIRALKTLGTKFTHDLVLVGANGWDMREIFKELEGSDLRSRVHFPGYVTDDELRGLYSNALAYIHPSLYEGFGLTVLEAMAMGCPVVTSNIYSLPEVAGDAACLVDPYNIDEIAQSILEVCTNSSYREELVIKGRDRARTFTWDKCSAEVVDVYRDVVKGRKS